MLTVKLKDLRNSQPQLEKILTQVTDMLASFKIISSLAAVVDQLQHVDKVYREKVIQYGEQLNDTEWKVKQENIEKFNEEMTTFLETEVEINCKKLNIELLKAVSVAPIELMPLLWLLENPE